MSGGAEDRNGKEIWYGRGTGVFPLFPSTSLLWSLRRASCPSSVYREHHHSGHLDVAIKWLLMTKHSSEDVIMGYFGLAAATKTIVGVFRQQWEKVEEE